MIGVADRVPVWRYVSSCRSASRKLYANIEAVADTNKLTRAEQLALSHAFGLSDPVWIRTAAITHCLRVRNTPQLVSFALMQPRCYPLSAHPTFDFVQQIVDGYHWRETELFQMNLRAGIDCEAYASRCQALADSIRLNGLLPYPGRPLANICVCIDEGGHPVHYKRGHHRLALAYALGLERVPVVVLGISAHHVLPFLGWHPLGRFGSMRRAVRTCVIRAADL